MSRHRNIRFQIKQIVKQTVQSAVLPLCYRAACRQAVDPRLVVFADAHHDRRPPSMELLYHQLKKTGRYRIREIYLDYGRASAAEIARHSVTFMKLYAAAGFAVICDNFLPAASCSKRPETNVIQLWHACGCYKRFGYDAKDDIPKDYHGGNVYKNTDLVTVSGEAAVKPFSSAMRLDPSHVKALGVSRTDLYFHKGWIMRCRDNFYKLYPEAKDKKVVLWAPTFRGNAGMPEEVPLDTEKLAGLLGDEYLVLTKLHPHMRRAANAGSHGDNSSGKNCPIPTEELYPVTDVLIADYSSLIYEYLLFRKPVVLYVPDLREYRSGRGFYMDIDDIPGEIVESPDEEVLAAAVKSAAADPERLEKFLDKYMGACDGHATERAVQWMNAHACDRLTEADYPVDLKKTPLQRCKPSKNEPINQLEPLKKTPSA